MSIMEVTSLEKLQHLAIAGLPKVTDNSIEFLAEHATVLAQLKISGCTRLSLEAVHRLLRRLKLERLEVSIPAMARPGTKRFSERAPPVCVPRHPGNRGVDHYMNGSFGFTGLEPQDAGPIQDLSG